MSKIKSVSASNRHISKTARRIREEEEAKVFGGDKKPPIAAKYLDKEGKKYFKNFVRLNHHLSYIDSEDLSQLCQYMVLHRKAMEAMDMFDIMSREYGNHLTQVMKLDKLISGFMSHLCLTYRERLRLANEMAKLKIEEQKLQQINEANKPKPENPLLALLRDNDDD